ncbi:prepilin-type N-terminal cleavage/methylation domain-containing protein [Lusitaniella coriacea]|uniref:prepilin-type N-terminal cleavage/methylation domain-containing protein n=1 Tax=Lusitaniella coriacea TaxID=1983105 RepID=UPI003CF8F53E
MKHNYFSPQKVSRLDSGFTLLELLAVISILSIISAIAIPSFLGLVKKQKINIVRNATIQYIRATQREALLEGQSYSATFAFSPEALKVAIYPTGSSESSWTWQKIGTNLNPKDVFVGTNVENHTIAFDALGNTQYAGFRVVVASLDTNENPIPKTMKCVIVTSSRGQMKVGDRLECGFLQRIPESCQSNPLSPIIPSPQCPGFISRPPSSLGRASSERVSKNLYRIEPLNIKY